MADKNVSALLVLYKPLIPSTLCPSFMFEKPSCRDYTRLDSSAKAQLAIYLEISQSHPSLLKNYYGIYFYRVGGHTQICRQTWIILFILVVLDLTKNT